MSLTRYVRDNGIFFESGSLWSWSARKEKYATFHGKAELRGWMNNFTEGRLGAAWGDIAWVATTVE
ncbi:MAG: hypothetical protein ACLKAK_13090 [Alkaliphilus sp.]